MSRRLGWIPMVIVVASIAVIGYLVIDSRNSAPAGIAVPTTAGADDVFDPAAGGPPLSSLLDDGQRPSEILLVGDGTGKSTGSWVFLAAQSLGQRFNRTVRIRDWLLGSVGRYSPPVRAWSGPGAPVTIWNASASRNIDYFRQSADNWIPADTRFDIVLVSNGVDVSDDELAQQSIEFIRAIAQRVTETAVVAVLQPTPPGRQTAAIGSTTAADDLRVSARINDLQTIDVDAAFEARDRDDLFVERSDYPNDAGYRLWASTVSGALATDIRTAAQR